MKVVLNSAILLLNDKNKSISPLFVSNSNVYKPNKSYEEYIKNRGNLSLKKQIFINLKKIESG